MLPIELASPTTTAGHSSRENVEKTASEKVVVAVRAEKEISRTALTWALTHVVRPGDRVMLLAVLAKENNIGRRLWNFPRFTGDCGSSSHRRRSPDRMCQISESCSQMALQFRDHNEVGVRIKVVSGSPAGVVAAESKRVGAKWVVLDKKLKVEEKHCMEDLHCNIVVMRHSQPKVLRLNLVGSDETQRLCSASALEEYNIEKSQDNRVKHSTPVSSPEDPKTLFTKSVQEASGSNSDGFVVCDHNPLFEGSKTKLGGAVYEHAYLNYYETSFDSELRLLPSTPVSSRTCIEKNVYWIPQNDIINKHSSIIRSSKNSHNNPEGSPTSRPFIERFVNFDVEKRIQELQHNQKSPRGHVFNSDVRDAVSLSRTSSAPPPLCSLCQHKAPVFGKPPRWFSYRELEEATDWFSEENFLAEGRFGSVYRGVLRDGEVVAVKQLKVAGAQGNNEFCKEVGLLGCAQHRNVVMLIGFCTEGRKRVLIYEYVCNGSLDFYLFGRNTAPLDWPSRLKIAIGVARGLRYLHEDCRVGCIVHRDLRPNNILLTHDFEPLVGDFGLSRWQPEFYLRTEQCLTRTLRYLAPEYAAGGKITQKADIYAFGVILLELITSQRGIGTSNFQRKQLLNEPYLPPLALEEQKHVQAIRHQVGYPCLELGQPRNFEHQLEAIGYAAACCLRQDPDSRPSMSKVLRILEGGDTLTLESDPIGNRSGRLQGLSANKHMTSEASHNRRLSH